MRPGWMTFGTGWMREIGGNPGSRLDVQRDVQPDVQRDVQPAAIRLTIFHADDPADAGLRLVAWVGTFPVPGGPFPVPGGPFDALDAAQLAAEDHARRVLAAALAALGEPGGADDAGEVDGAGRDRAGSGPATQGRDE